MKFPDTIDLVRRLHDSYPSVFLDLLDAIAAYREIQKPLWTADGLRNRIANASEILAIGGRLSPADPDDLLAMKLLALHEAPGGTDLLVETFAKLAGFDMAGGNFLPEGTVPDDWEAIQSKLDAIPKTAVGNIVPTLPELLELARAIARLIEIFVPDDRLRAMIERA